MNLKTILSSARATIMEGSFVTHKRHNGLDKIKAIRVKREMLWAFFSIMAADAVIISKGMALDKPL